MSVRNAVMRERITAIAARLFQERGVNGVSMQEIAKEVGLSKAALYHYYDNRDDLLRHIFGDWARGEIDAVRAIADSDAEPDVKLARFIRTHLNGIADNMDLYALSFREESELPADVRSEFRGLKRENDRLVRGIINEGTQRGVFEPVDQRLTVFAVIGMCNWLWKWYKPGVGQTVDNIADTFSTLILRGLSADVRGVREGEPPAEAERVASAVAYHARALRHHSRMLEEALASMDAAAAQA